MNHLGRCGHLIFHLEERIRIELKKEFTWRRFQESLRPPLSLITTFNGSCPLCWLKIRVLECILFKNRATSKILSEMRGILGPPSTDTRPANRSWCCPSPPKLPNNRQDLEIEAEFPLLRFLDQCSWCQGIGSFPTWCHRCGQIQLVIQIFSCNRESQSEN